MAALDLLAQELLDALVHRLETDPQLSNRLREVLAPDRAEGASLAFMRVDEYGVRRGVARCAVERWMREGMPVIGNGRGRRIDVERADAWLRARTRGAPVTAEEAAERGAAAGRLKVVQ